MLSISCVWPATDTASHAAWNKRRHISRSFLLLFFFFFQLPTKSDRNEMSRAYQTMRKLNISYGFAMQRSAQLANAIRWIIFYTTKMQRMRFDAIHKFMVSVRFEIETDFCLQVIGFSLSHSLSLLCVASLGSSHSPSHSSPGRPDWCESAPRLDGMHWIQESSI